MRNNTKPLTIKLPEEDEEFYLQIMAHSSIRQILEEYAADCKKSGEHKKKMWVDVDRYENNRRIHHLGVISEKQAIEYFVIGILIAQINNLITRLDGFYTKNDEGHNSQIASIQNRLSNKNKILEGLRGETILSLSSQDCRYEMAIIIFIDEFRVYIPDDYIK
jgi:hypothetical protein